MTASVHLFYWLSGLKSTWAFYTRCYRLKHAHKRKHTDQPMHSQLLLVRHREQDSRTTTFLSRRSNLYAVTDCQFGHLRLISFPSAARHIISLSHYHSVYISHAATGCTQSPCFWSLWQHYFLLQAARFLWKVKSFIRCLNKKRTQLPHFP